MGIESESLLPQTRRLLRRCGLQARKRLGQHFLVDEDVLELIISTAELTPNDVVLEIGPGLFFYPPGQAVYHSKRLVAGGGFPGRRECHIR